MTPNDAIDQIMPRIQVATRLGYRLLQDGTALFGQVPHVAPEAWLHIVYRPLREREIVHLEKVLGRSLPTIVANFLNISNGLYLFSGSLSLDGLRTDYSRDLDVRQPFHLKTPNVDERPQDAEDHFFFIGGYGWDGSLLYLDERSHEVHRCTPECTRPLNSWPNFRTMLVEEFVRLEQLFDEAGRERDPNRPTTPDPGRSVTDIEP